MAHAHEVGAAWTYIESRKEQYRLKRVTKPHSTHFANSIYLRRTYLTRSNRFTLTLASPAAVEAARRELASTAGITELDEIQDRGGQISFTFSDLDRNWWEITSSAG